MKLDILVRLIPQVSTIICHHMKKVLFKKEQIKKGNTRKYGGLDQNP